MATAKPLSERDEAKKREALEHSFLTTLEAITDLPPDQQKHLAEKFTDRTLRSISRQELKQPAITWKPKNASKIVFEMDTRNSRRSPQGALEKYLEDRDRSTERWDIRQREDIGSKTKFVATRGPKSSSDDGSSSSSASDDPMEEIEETINKLDDSQKEALSDVLDL